MSHPLHSDQSSEPQQPGDDFHVSSGTSKKRERRIEPWMLQLKEAYAAGYYKTESAIGDQTFAPWFGKV